MQMVHSGQSFCVSGIVRSLAAKPNRFVRRRAELDREMRLCRCKVVDHDGRHAAHWPDRRDPSADRQRRGLPRLPLGAGGRVRADRPRRGLAAAARLPPATRSGSSCTGWRSPPGGVRRRQRDRLQLRRPRRRRRRGGGRGTWSVSSCRAVGGAAITVSFVHLSRRWCRCCQGSGRSASASACLPRGRTCRRASGWVALYYYAAGIALLWIARGPGPLHGWWVGGDVRRRAAAGRAGSLLEPRTARRASERATIMTKRKKTDERRNPDDSPTKGSSACCTRRRGSAS